MTDIPEALELRSPAGRSIRIHCYRHPRARHLRLRVTPEGPRLSWPQGVSAKTAARFVQQNRNWLLQQLDALGLLDAAAPALEVGVDNRLLWRGQQLALQWQQAPRPTIIREPQRLNICLPDLHHPDSLQRARQLLQLEMERSVRKDIAHWLPEQSATLGQAPRGIRLGILKSRWGSLGIHNHMRLDLTLALAPPQALRYVLAHEMAHLAERNHSPRFWRQVERLMPDYASQRHWLRSHGGRLKVELNRLLVDCPPQSPTQTVALEPAT